MLESQWNEFYRILTDGNPPLAVQLLVVNTIFLIFFAFRRTRGASAMRREVGLSVQILLIVANLAVLFNGQLFSRVTGYL